MTTAYLEITLKISAENRAKAGAVYSKYKQPFLSTIPGAQSKDLLLREEDSYLVAFIRVEPILIPVTRSWDENPHFA